jgi:hypothetical protein
LLIRTEGGPKALPPPKSFGISKRALEIEDRQRGIR